MKFRLTAFGLHLLGSACALTLVLGTLYLGWYRWPGWYLTGVLHVAPLVLGVDLALGPLVTLLIASPTKPRGELKRDVLIVVLVQLAALAYGAITLWQGRPLYYTFSENRLEMVQASDLDPREVALAMQANPAFAPHWYSRPRWVWAPLPQDASTRSRIIQSSLAGGDDVIQMPRYFKAWEQGVPVLCQHLRPVGKSFGFSPRQFRNIKERFTALGIDVDQPVALVMVGRRGPLAVAFDCPSGRVKAMMTAD